MKTPIKNKTLNVVVVTRDINGEQQVYETHWSDIVRLIAYCQITEEDEILLVIVEDTCIYSSLGSDRALTLDDLTGYFA